MNTDTQKMIDQCSKALDIKPGILEAKQGVFLVTFPCTHNGNLGGMIFSLNIN